MQTKVTVNLTADQVKEFLSDNLFSGKAIEIEYNVVNSFGGYQVRSIDVSYREELKAAKKNTDSVGPDNTRE